MDTDFDILVAGGGLAGMTAAAVFAAEGQRVCCVDPMEAPADEQDPARDLRTTAILQPGRTLLEAAGIWPRLAPHATPLEIMRIIDANRPTTPHDFRSDDISDLPFGWNLPNWLLRQEIAGFLHEAPRVAFKTGLSVTGHHGRGPMARIRLSDGATLTAKLTIAADGRDSSLRKASGIGTRRVAYGQKALAFSVGHSIPHDNISTEIHATGGPFTLVPLPDRDGQHRSAVVWMDDGPLQSHRETLGDGTFNAAITERSLNVLGQLECLTPRALWPIISQHSHALAAPRLALMAEAAHVVPPIGAQGLNMSFKDISTLRDCIAKTPDDPGQATALHSYERRRMPDILAHVAGVDLLNRASQVSNPLLRRGRATALDALHRITPVRKSLMRLGLGAT